jgi:hypothetical protein
MGRNGASGADISIADTKASAATSSSVLLHPIVVFGISGASELLLSTVILQDHATRAKVQKGSSINGLYFVRFNG